MKNRPLCSVCLILFLVMCIGIHMGKERFIKELRPSPLEQHMSEGESLLLRGQIYKKEIKDNYQILYLKNNSIQRQKQFLYESKMIVYDEQKTNVFIGQKLQVTGELSFFEPAYNPGNFDRKLYYQKQGIHASVWAEQIKITDKNYSLFFQKLYKFRQQWQEVLGKYMSEKNSGVLAAMILGEKGDMDAETKELYQVNGIGHILAISGLHLSFIGIGMYKILRRMTGSYPAGGIAGILFLTIYILMIGLTVSVIRALVMFLFRVGADMTGRHYDAPTALASAAVVILIWRPLCLYDGGFWLSFGAVMAVLIVVPVLQEWKGNFFPENKGRDNKHFIQIINAVMQGFVASIGINLMLLPISLYYFFEFPIYSFLLNLFVIPLMSVLLFMGMAGSLLSFCILPLSDICFGVCSGILQFYKVSCNLALTLPGACFVVGKPELWQVAVYYGILAVVLLLLKEKERMIEHVDSIDDTENKKYKKGGRGTDSRKCVVDEFGADLRKKAVRLGRLAFFLEVAGIIILTCHWGERGKLMAAVLDVGQGDGIFVRGPEGGTYLVDGGSSDVKKVGQYRLEPFLKSQGVGVLDYVLVSHGDSDHINGVEELLERQDIGVKIRTLVLPVQEVWDEALERLAEKARNLGIRAAIIEAGQSIKEGKMTITCIQPGNTGMKSEDIKAGNAASMVLAVRYGEFDMLLTGDVEEEGEKQLTEQLEEQYQDCTWEILKVAHHGSKNSSAEEFLGQVQPAYALISAGRENRYRHPHQETIKRLMDVGSKIYSTQENGALIVEVESGETMKIKK